MPYLHADPIAVAAWQAKIPVAASRVGLVRAGRQHTDNAAFHLIDQRRSLGLGQLAPLADIAGVAFLSLRKDKPETPEIAPQGLKLIDLMSDVSDFADTAALIANLDLVISIDTSVAHLAVALGRPVWLRSRYDGCWRWLHERGESPWMRIYRQERSHDWSSVIQRLEVELIALVRRKRLSEQRRS